MPTNVVMPQMGESIVEGTLTKWLKKPGDGVQRDEPLFEISTDKVDAEIPSPAAGILSKVLVQEGQTVQINTVVAEIEEAGAQPLVPARETVPPPAPVGGPPVAAQAPTAPPPLTAPQAVSAPPKPAQPPAPDAGPAPQPVVPPVVDRRVVMEEEAEQARQQTLAAIGEGGVVRGAVRSVTDYGAFISPLVRRLAAEHGVDLSKIKGTGLGGRVTKSDILSYVEAQKRTPAREAAEQPQAVGAPPVAKPAGPGAGAPAAPPRAAAPAVPPSPAPAAPAAYGERIEVVPLSPMRQKIAERMVESRRTAAHVNSVFQVDMTRIVKLREQWKQEFEQRNGVKLTYMPFICRAAISALKAFPTVNASLQGANLLVKKDVNLGIAVALEWGLIVPVVKNADEKNFLGLTRAIHDLADRARNKKLSPDDVQGGTFTITNPGQFGAMFGLPIIPQPQLAILGVGSIHKEPVVIDDAIAIRSIVYLSLSYDHRAIDGALADQFMAHVKQVLENWEEPIL